jgi:ABC-type transporter Mla subunit MlaD
MVDVIHRLKVPQHLKEAVDTLAEVSKSISDRANALVAAIENLDEVITNSKDLSKLMHGYGLNMRYLGLVL